MPLCFIVATTIGASPPIRYGKPDVYRLEAYLSLPLLAQPTTTDQQPRPAPRLLPPTALGISGHSGTLLNYVPPEIRVKMKHSTINCWSGAWVHSCTDKG